MARDMLADTLPKAASALDEATYNFVLARVQQIVSKKGVQGSEHSAGCFRPVRDVDAISMGARIGCSSP